VDDRRRWSLRDAVRACRVERTWYSQRCGADSCENEEHHDLTLIEFLPTGSVVSQRHQNPDGSEWKATYAYDEAGRLLTINSDGGAGGSSVRLHEYDTAGRLTRVLVRTAEGREHVDETYQYDGVGRKQRTFHPDPFGPFSSGCCFFGVESTDTSYSAPGTTTVVTRYDDADQPLSLSLQDAAGRELTRVEFTYDGFGQLIDETQTTAANVVPTEMMAEMKAAQLESVRSLLGAGSKRLHRYDAQGRRIETTSGMFGPLGRERQTMAYNDRGDQTEVITEDEHRGFGFGDGGEMIETEHRTSRSEARFRYVYDERGNWIEKVVEWRQRTEEDFSVSAVERRTITYYE